MKKTAPERFLEIKGNLERENPKADLSIINETASSIALQIHHMGIPSFEDRITGNSLQDGNAANASLEKDLLEDHLKDMADML
mgnify:CR=1 FL=1